MAAQLSAYVLAKTEELAHLEAELQALAAQAFAYCSGTCTSDTKPFEAVNESVKAAVRAALGAGLFPELPGFPANGLDQAKRHAPSAGGAAYNDLDDVPLLKRQKPSVDDALSLGKSENAKPTVNQLAPDEVGPSQTPVRIQSIGGNEPQTSASSRFCQGSEVPKDGESEPPNIQIISDSQALDTRTQEAKPSLSQPPRGPDANLQQKEATSEDRAQPSEPLLVAQPPPQHPSADAPTRKRPPLWLRQMLPSRSRPKLAAAITPKPPVQPTRSKKAEPQDPAATPAETLATADKPLPLPSMSAPIDASADTPPGPVIEPIAPVEAATCSSRQHGDQPAPPPQADLNQSATGHPSSECAPAPPKPQQQATGPPPDAPVNVRPDAELRQQMQTAHIDSANQLQPGSAPPLLRESSPPGPAECNMPQGHAAAQTSAQAAGRLPQPGGTSTPAIAELSPSLPNCEQPGIANLITPTGTEAEQRETMRAGSLAGVARNTACGSLLRPTVGGCGISLPPRAPAVIPCGPRAEPQQQRQQLHQRLVWRSSPRPSAGSAVDLVDLTGGTGLTGNHHHSRSASSRLGSTQTITTSGTKLAASPSGSLLADSLLGQPPQAAVPQGSQGLPQGAQQQQEATSPEEGVRQKRKWAPCVAGPLAAGEDGVKDDTAARCSKGTDVEGMMREQLIDMPLASRVRKRTKAAGASEGVAAPGATAATAMGGGDVPDEVGMMDLTSLGAVAEPVFDVGSTEHQQRGAAAVSTATETRVHANDADGKVEVEAAREQSVPEVTVVGAGDDSSDCGQSYGAVAVLEAAEWVVGADMGAAGEGSSAPLAQEVVDDWSPAANLATAGGLAPPASPRLSGPRGPDVCFGREAPIKGARDEPLTCEEQGTAASRDVLPPAAVSAGGGGGLAALHSWPCHQGEAAVMEETVWAKVTAVGITAARAPSPCVTAGLAAAAAAGSISAGDATVVGEPPLSTAAAEAPLAAVGAPPDAPLSDVEGKAPPVLNTAGSSLPAAASGAAAQGPNPEQPLCAPAALAPEAMAEVGFTGGCGGRGDTNRPSPQDAQPTGTAAAEILLETFIATAAAAAAAAAAASGPSPTGSATSISGGVGVVVVGGGSETVPGGLNSIPQPHLRSQTTAPTYVTSTMHANHADGPQVVVPTCAPAQPPPGHADDATAAAAAHIPTETHPLFARCSAPQGSITTSNQPPSPVDLAPEHLAVARPTIRAPGNAQTVTADVPLPAHTAPTTTTDTVNVSRGFARESFESYSMKQPSSSAAAGGGPTSAAAGVRPAEVPPSGLVHERHHKPAGHPSRRPPLVSQVEVPRDPHAALAAAAAALMAALEGDGEGGDCDLPDFPSPIATGFQAPYQQQAAGNAPPVPVHAPPRESEEAAAKRRAAEAARKAAARASESEEKAAKRRAVQAARSAMRRAAQPPEEAALKRKAHAARQAAYRRRRKDQRTHECPDQYPPDMADPQDIEHDYEPFYSSGPEDGPPAGSGSVSQSLHDDRSERQEDGSNMSQQHVASGEVREANGGGNEGPSEGVDRERVPLGGREGLVGSQTAAPFSDASVAAVGGAVDTDEVSSPVREQGPATAGGATSGGAAAGCGNQAAAPYVAGGDAVRGADEAEAGPTAIAGVAGTGEAEPGVGTGTGDSPVWEEAAQNMGHVGHGDGSGPEGGCDGGLARGSSDNEGGYGTGSDTGVPGPGHVNVEEHGDGEGADLTPEIEVPLAGRRMSEVEQEEWRRRAAEIERQRAEAAAEREAARRARNAQRAPVGPTGGLAMGGGGGSSGGGAGGPTSEEDLQRRIRQRLEMHHQLATAAAAEAEAKEVIRSQVRARLQDTHRKALEERNLTRLLKQLGALPKGASLRSAEQRGKALKAAKIRFHPDKASGGLEARVYAEEVSKLLNSWEWV